MHPEKKTCYTWKPRDITIQLTHVCDRIFIFLPVALCLLASINDLFLRLHYQVTLVTSNTPCNTTHYLLVAKRTTRRLNPSKINSVHDGSCNFLFNWMCELHPLSYHPTQLQKQLQSLQVFQKDRLETVHHLCTLCNIWRHSLITSLGMWDITCSHHTWQHIAHAWQWSHWHMLLRREPCQ